MKQYLFRYKTIIIVFIIALINCAFVPVKTKGDYTKSNATSNLINPAGLRARVKKIPFINRLIHKLNVKLKKDNKGGSIGLVVIIALLLFLLLIVITYALAFAGASGTLAGIIFFGGLALILFGAVRTIRAIKRKRKTALLTPNKIESFDIDKDVLGRIKAA